MRPRTGLRSVYVWPCHRLTKRVSMSLISVICGKVHLCNKPLPRPCRVRSCLNLPCFPESQGSDQIHRFHSHPFYLQHGAASREAKHPYLTSAGRGERGEMKDGKKRKYLLSTGVFPKGFPHVRKFFFSPFPGLHHPIPHLYPLSPHPPTPCPLLPGRELKLPLRI